jgi:hypothetical protein
MTGLAPVDLTAHGYGASVRPAGHGPAIRAMGPPRYGDVAVHRSDPAGSADQAVQQRSDAAGRRPADCADVADLERAVGFRTKAPIEDDIRHFVDWFRRYDDVECRQRTSSRTHRSKMPSRLEPVPGAGQAQTKVRKTLETTKTVPSSPCRRMKPIFGLHGRFLHGPSSSNGANHTWR